MSLPSADQSPNPDLVDRYDYHQRPTRTRAAAFVDANLPPGPPTNQQAALGHHLTYHSARYHEAAAAQNSTATTSQTRRLKALQYLWETWPAEKWFPDAMFADENLLPAMVAVHAASMTRLWCQKRSVATMWDAFWGDHDARAETAAGFFPQAMRDASADVLTVPVAADALRRLKVSLGVDYTQGRGARRGPRRRAEPEPGPAPAPAPMPAPELPRASLEDPSPPQHSSPAPLPGSAFGSPVGQTPPPLVARPSDMDEDDDIYSISSAEKERTQAREKPQQGGLDDTPRLAPSNHWLPHLRELVLAGGIRREGSAPGVLWVEFDQICDQAVMGREASETVFKWLLKCAEAPDTGVVLAQGERPSGNLFVWVGPDGHPDDDDDDDDDDLPLLSPISDPGSPLLLPLSPSPRLSRSPSPSPDLADRLAQLEGVYLQQLRADRAAAVQARLQLLEQLFRRQERSRRQRQRRQQQQQQAGFYATAEEAAEAAEQAAAQAVARIMNRAREHYQPGERAAAGRAARVATRRSLARARARAEAEGESEESESDG
ncbi:hypothetical protein ColLi_13117 [Colletotrichum liriopes]|uniref:Uncharacterized protein n=1 Tax=Colletotrichum liriopes TaxID=708192 RepID=A0AA37LZE7_9PEZI|nr:hypothetical protein ColLi_13117 [Colletotrichum liriopes]